MTANAVPMVMGLDGKRYPRQKIAREVIAGRVHYLAHEDGLSVRGIVAALDADGIRRSVGTVHALLHDYSCPACSGGRS